jgi:hypothetical protein
MERLDRWSSARKLGSEWTFSSTKTAFRKCLSQAGLEISLEPSRNQLGLHADIAFELCRQERPRGPDVAAIVRGISTLQLTCGADINIAVTELEKIYAPHGLPSSTLVKGFASVPLSAHLRQDFWWRRAHLLGQGFAVIRERAAFAEAYAMVAFGQRHLPFGSTLYGRKTVTGGEHYTPKFGPNIDFTTIAPQSPIFAFPTVVPQPCPSAPRADLSL